ncbi:hypothetical protein V8B97DRAFT_2102705 [Scleroderma yunnanense]
MDRTTHFRPLPHEIFMEYRNVLVNLLSYSLDGAVADTYTNPQSHTCDFYRPCRCPSSHDGFCGETISCNTVAAHFRDRHGIVDLPRKGHVVCSWHGCSKQISRHNFVRHVREKHLCHQRP